MATEVVEVEGHIVDSLILAKILDMIVEAGADYQLLELDVGRTSSDASRARIEVIAADEDVLRSLVDELQIHGANRASAEDASLVAADTDGVLPAGFYATTNLATEVRVDAHWIRVANPEMDCAITVRPSGEVRTVPMHGVRVGDAIVVGSEGVRVSPMSRPRGPGPFEFMGSDVSSEKPKGKLVAQVAERMRIARADGGRILVVCGPALVHTGAGPAFARLVRNGWVDVLFAGNGFATHDIESNVMGTSLGVPVASAPAADGAHANHIRTINEVRRRGSIAAAVADGLITGGVMYECVQRRVPFVLGGSIRDDGPLPDTMTDVVVAADAMRGQVEGVTVALMLATTLHAIATGNILPAGVETYCVDINQAVVTKLSDRGSHQALGIVTDVGLFVQDLAAHLVP